MSPGDYVAELHRVLQSHPFIATYHLGTDVRGESFLYVTGKVEFLFGSTLDFKEFLEFHQGRLGLFTRPPFLPVHFHWTTTVSVGR